MTDALLGSMVGIMGLCILVGAWLVFRDHPRLTMAVWAAVLFLVPIWVGVQAGVYFSALVIVSILGIASASLDGMRWSVVDSLIVGFVVLLLLASAWGGATSGHLMIVLVDWMVPYAWGRVVLSRVDINWVYGALATAAVVAAVLAILEFISGVNLFVGFAMPNSQYQTWSELQLRGGLLRVEGSFGHSIALGSSLAIASVFVAATKWPFWMRLTSLVIVLTAAGMTLSRIGLVGIILTLLLAAALLGRWLTRTLRIALVALLTVVAGIGVPLMWDVFTSAGDEAVGSAAYRTDLTSLVSDFSLLGISPSWAVSPTGDTYFGSFQSIDNQLILTGLRFGLLPVGVLVLALVICLITVLRGRSTPASIAVVAQIPAFVSVALITQYAEFVWFTAGLAVASYSLSTMHRPTERDGGEIERLSVERAGTT